MIPTVTGFSVTEIEGQVVRLHAAMTPSALRDAVRRAVAQQRLERRVCDRGLVRRRYARATVIGRRLADAEQATP